MKTAVTLFRHRAQPNWERCTDRVFCERNGFEVRDFVPAEHADALADALEALIGTAHGMDGALEQEFGVSTDADYGVPDPEITKAEAALTHYREPTA